MSAVLQSLPLTFAALVEADLVPLMAIERFAYAHPWTLGNFADSLNAGYVCRGLWQARVLIGYSVVMPGVDEAHLLNVTVAPRVQRQGFGRMLLDDVIVTARGLQAARLLLEVRPSNLSAQALYVAYGFTQVGRRVQYYPAAQGKREDALVFALNLAQVAA